MCWENLLVYVYRQGAVGIWRCVVFPRVCAPLERARIGIDRGVKIEYYIQGGNLNNQLNVIANRDYKLAAVA